MIILEGPDGAGKTTLATWLVKKFDLTLAEKVVLSNTEPVRNLTEYVELTLDQGLSRTLYDRHPIISEPIYAGALRLSLKPGFNSTGWMTTQMVKLMKLRPFIIYCLPSLPVVEENVWRNTQSAKDNEVVQQKIHPIWGMYAALATRDAAAGRAIIHNYKADGSQRRIDMVLGHWLEAKGL